ncbi:MAG: iron ABC transporter substrate-binding protein [Thermoproteota archaeon]
MTVIINWMGEASKLRGEWSGQKTVIISVVLLVTVMIGVLVFTNLGETKPERGEETITIMDMTGREVEVPEKVDEIIGLEAGALRLITYLNCTDRVVGVEEFEKMEEHQKGRPYILAHPELSNLPSIGPIHGGDPELIAAQNPDVIFWTETTAGDAEDLQQRTGIPVIAVEYGDLGANQDTIFEGLSLMGKVLDADQRAEEVIQYIELTIQDLEDRTQSIPLEEKVEVYVGGVSYRGSHGILGTEPRYAPFQFVDAENVVPDNLGVEHVMVSAEKIVEWNPDIIFVDEGGYSMVMEDLQEAKFRTLKAVQNGEIYGVLPQSYYTHNFGTVLADSYYIGKTLYPTRFMDIDPELKADEIYLELVGEPVYNDMKKDFGGFQRIELPD